MNIKDYNKLIERKKEFLEEIKKEFKINDIGISISIYNIDIKDEIWNDIEKELVINEKSIWFTNPCTSEINLYTSHFKKNT